MGRLTKKQKLVFDYICEYVRDNSYSPTQVEIQEYFGFKSLGSVQDYIRYLTSAGYLRNDSNAVRGLDPVLPEEEVQNQTSSNIITHVEIPLLGKVAAGIPIEAIEGSDLISIPQSMLRQGNHFALTVSGESMIEDGIFDGDTLVVKEQKSASNGETIIAMVDNEATVKRLQKHKDHIELIPANSALKPIIVPASKNFEIKGIVVGLLRTY
ncbi:MAG: repressor LexA [Thermoproteota archaeon]|jgi:repressor LexA